MSSTENSTFSQWRKWLKSSVRDYPCSEQPNDQPKQVLVMAKIHARPKIHFPKPNPMSILHNKFNSVHKEAIFNLWRQNKIKLYIYKYNIVREIFCVQTSETLCICFTVNKVHEKTESNNELIWMTVLPM